MSAERHGWKRFRSWPMFLSLAVIVLASGAFMATRKQRGNISALIVGQTNGQVQVSISNATDERHSVQIWAEWTSDGKNWKRDISNPSPIGGFRSISLTLKPGHIQTESVPLPPAGNKHRLRVSHYALVSDGFMNWRYWRRDVQLRLGLKPAGPERFYLKWNSTKTIGSISLSTRIAVFIGGVAALFRRMRELTVLIIGRRLFDTT